MKKLLSILLSLSLAAAALAQTNVNVQKTGAPNNAITGDLTFGSGRTLTLASGSNLVLAAGTFTPSAGSIAWSALTGQPTTLAGYGITDPIVLTSGSYADPAWITSFAATKLTGTVAAARLPAFTGDATSTVGTSALTLAASGVTAASYGSATQAPVLTFDAKGRATAASLITIAPLFSSVASKPTSASGYGIVNGSNIDAWGAKTIPSGTVADLSSVQVFSNKSVSGSANTITNVPLGTAVTGTLPGANFPALSGDVTTSAGSLATSYAGVVPASKGGAGAVSGLLKANGSGTVSAASSGTDYAPAGDYVTALTGDVTASGPGSAPATVTKLNGTSLAGLATGILKNATATGVPSIAVAGVDYQTPLTFSTGLTNTGGTITVNTSQNVAKLSNLTSNGFVKTSAGDGTLSIDTATYITGNQTITLSGDASGSGATSIAVTNTKLNGVSLAGLATGLLKNTTATGVPSIGAAGTDYVAPGGAGSVSGLSANGAIYAATGTTLASTAALTNGQILIGSTSAVPVRANVSGTANEITVANGAGTITLSLPAAITGTGKTVTGGTFNVGAITGTSIDGPVGSITPNTGSFTTFSSSGTGGIGTPGTGFTLNLRDYNTGTAAIWSMRDDSAIDRFRFARGSSDKVVWDVLKGTGDNILGQQWYAVGAMRMEITSTGINSAAIGATTPAAGTFTTVTATAGANFAKSAGNGRIKIANEGADTYNVVASRNAADSGYLPLVVRATNLSVDGGLVATTIGASSPDAGTFTTLTSTTLIAATHTPSSASDTGVAGTIAWDSSFVYVCVATNTWKRVAIATW